VIGGGSVGLLGGLILQSWGAREVRLAETNPLHRQTAVTAGLNPFDPIAAPAEAASFDLVLHAVGGVATRAAAIAAVRPGGVIAHVGLQDGAGEFDACTLTLSEIAFVGVYTYTDADQRASLAALHDVGWGSWTGSSVERKPRARRGFGTSTPAARRRRRSY
jgi:alcohol dehydrogenase